MARRELAAAVAGTTCVTATLAAGVVWLLIHEPAVGMEAAGTGDMGMLFGVVLDLLLDACWALIRYLQATP
jgi:hypothetical protein